MAVSPAFVERFPYPACRVGSAAKPLAGEQVLALGEFVFQKRVVFFQNPDQFFRNDDHPVPVPFGFWYDQVFCPEAEVFKFYQSGFLGTEAAAEQKPEIHGNL